MAHHGHHGKSQHRQRDVPMPAMPGPRLVVIEPKLGLRRPERILDRPAMPLNRHPSSIPVPAGHQVEKNASWPSAMLRRIRSPRVHRPVSPSAYAPASRSASSQYAQSSSRSPFAPSPAERRCQALSSSPAAIASAGPATGGLSPQEGNPSVAFAPRTEPLPARLSLISTSPHPYTVSAAPQRNGTPAASARSIIASASRGLVAKGVPGGT